MANPNINTPSFCFANNALVSLSSTSETQIVSNSSSSGAVYLFDSIVAANTSASSVDISITMYAATTNTGTAYRVANTITVPAKSTLVVVSKNVGLNLKESQSLYATASASASLVVTAFWKEFS
jgi:hypothetical protein